jgi:uncharacterized protein (TIGR02246 family)
VDQLGAHFRRLGAPTVTTLRKRDGGQFAIPMPMDRCAFWRMMIGSTGTDQEGKIMRKTIIIAIAGAAAFSLLSGCNKPAATVDADSIKQAIRADEAKWNKEFKAKDTESLVGHYADDAYFVAPGVTADGSTQIRKVYATASTDPAFNIEFSSDRVDVAGSGDLAYSRGKFTEKYTDSKTCKVMTGSGTYITVYKKQDDGSWKVVEDIAAADPASIKPVPPEKPATRAKMASF